MRTYHWERSKDRIRFLQVNESRWLARVSLEARQVKAALSAMPVKTDRNDAHGIAQVVRTGWFKPVHVKSIGGQRVGRWRLLASISSAPSLPQSKSSDDFCVRSVSKSESSRGLCSRCEFVS
ncbi:hypothetical protein CQ12_16940 [Bradyrhizobium jicamae]|uniref:Uncharacterized protein n=1 Tax=Bradyrhizobium jicamae TaxID=280332 RepID=A0A0R3KVV8_9BRAD|nr:hypothetical protein CQ12_16940 [Bradyrhizobium jicamae]